MRSGIQKDGDRWRILPHGSDVEGAVAVEVSERACHGNFHDVVLLRGLHGSIPITQQQGCIRSDFLAIPPDYNDVELPVTVQIAQQQCLYVHARLGARACAKRSVTVAQENREIDIASDH